MGWSTDQHGRPACQQLPPPPTIGAGLSWAFPSLNIEVWTVLSGFALVLGLHLVELRLNLRSDIFCNFLSVQSVLATCILAQKHILHNSKGKVWFRGLFE